MDDLRVEAFLSGRVPCPVGKSAVLAGMVLALALFAPLFVTHHIAQRIKAGGIGVALGVFVGQARFRLIGRSGVLLVGIDPNLFAAHALTNLSAADFVRQRQPMSRRVRMKLQPRLSCVQI